MCSFAFQFTTLFSVCQFGYGGIWEYAFEPEHRYKKSKYGSEECRGILHTLKNENEEYFIAPRDELLNAYQEWLGENLCNTFPPEEGKKKWEDRLCKAGLNLKRSNKRNDSWRYQYYKGQPPVCCVGILMKEIKEAVKNTIYPTSTVKVNGLADSEVPKRLNWALK